MRKTRACFGLVLGLLIAAPGSSRADVVANEFYDLDDTTAPIEPPLGWTQPVPGGTRTGININTGASATKFYTRNDIAIDSDQNWSFETVVSSADPGIGGERGARMSIKFSDASALMLPPAGLPKFRFIELRLEEEVPGGRRFALVDGNSGAEKASLALDWSDPAPRWRIRIRRDGTDIIMEAEPAHAGPLMTDPSNFPEPPPHSETVPIANFSFPIGSANEFGFGHFVAGSYDSFWEDIHVTAADDATTPLPYWPTPPPAPILVIGGSSTPGTLDIDFDVDLGPHGAYLTNDVALLSLDSSGGSDARTIADPSNTNGGLLHEDFNGLALGQTVAGTVMVNDISGRSRTGPATLLQLLALVPALGPLATDFAVLAIVATGLIFLRRRRLTSGCS